MLPPTIPTSFVPHSVPTASRGSRVDFTGVFSFIAYTILLVVFALAIGVFFYGRILASDQTSKDSQLATAEAAIDPATAENFVRLRNRIVSGEKLLAGHIAFSGFFSALENLVPTTVRFNSLHLSIDNSGAVKLEGSGMAKSFNALAVASTAFAKDGRIKNAIFSNIVVSQRDSSVSFSITATLDPKLVAFSPKAYVAAPSVPVAPVTTSVATSTMATSSAPSTKTGSTTPPKKKL